VPLTPDEIDPERLPRASLGGFKPGPVEDLLKRVEWDYRQLLHDDRVLHETIAQLQGRNEELERHIDALEKAASRQKEPDELARQALAASQRAARELRDSTRRDCELALKKARARARRIERHSYRENARAVAELRNLQDLRHALQERLQSSLLDALAQVEDAREVPTLDADPLGRLDAVESATGSSLTD
jgi:cell division septum initiation protein DivIVA